MHELGIIIHISKTLEEIAAENQVTEIGSVTLEIGEVSGIVPDFLTDCWEYFRKQKPLIEHAKLIMDILPAVTFCEDCKKEYATVTYGKECPHCHSGNTYLLTGNECSIKEIEAC